MDVVTSFTIAAPIPLFPPKIYPPIPVNVPMVIMPIGGKKKKKKRKKKRRIVSDSDRNSDSDEDDDIIVVVDVGRRGHQIMCVALFTMGIIVLTIAQFSLYHWHDQSIFILFSACVSLIISILFTFSLWLISCTKIMRTTYFISIISAALFFIGVIVSLLLPVVAYKQVSEEFFTLIFTLPLIVKLLVTVSVASVMFLLVIGVIIVIQEWMYFTKRMMNLIPRKRKGGGYFALPSD